MFRTSRPYELLPDLGGAVLAYLGSARGNILNACNGGARIYHCAHTLRMAKVDKQPEGPGGVVAKANPTESAWVAGRSKGFIYTCWNDGAGNNIHPDWNSWTCWPCGTTYSL